MGNSFFNEYPYTDFHELNLSWVVKELRTFATTLEQFVSINALKYADPIQWNITTQYEKNTIVIDPQTGVAYISVAPVPAGVALTDTDYWTEVFDLGRFVVRAAKNFTSRYEADTTLTATFNTNAGDWLVWGDTLYRANVNITAGDSYIEGGNITHITVEEITGHLADLNTTDKTNLVSAINAVLVTLSTITGDLSSLSTTDKSNLVAAINEVLTTLSTVTGDLSSLSTTDKSNLVAAINEVLTTLNTVTGDLSSLSTTDKSNLVAAINEILTTLFNTTGNLADLSTTDKSNLVAAINEVDDKIDNLKSPIYTNVKDYGATGNGVTDDTNAVMAALNVINTNGGVLYFPNGRYLISSTIQLTHPGSTVKGETAQGVYVVMTADLPCIVCGTGVENTVSMRVENIALDCTSPSVTGNNCGVFFNKSVNGTINNIIVNNFLVGVRFMGSGNAYVTDVGVVSSRSNAIGYDVGDSSVSNNFTNVWAGFSGDAGENGIGFLMISGIVADVTINYLDVANGAYALRVDGASSTPLPPTDLRFNNIVCDGQRVAGIYLSNITYGGSVVVNGGWMNVLPSATVTDILLIACHNITITDMTFQQVAGTAPVYPAISGSGDDNIIVTDCNFINTVMGVTIASVNELKVRGCTMRLYPGNTSPSPAIYCTTATKCIVTDNVIDDFTSAIAFISGDNVIVKNNIVKGVISAPLTTVIVSDNLTVT